MDCLSLRGIANAFVFGIFFGMGFVIASNILHFLGTFIH